MEIIFELLYEIIIEGATGDVGWTIILSVIALIVIILMISIFIKPPKDND